MGTGMGMGLNLKNNTKRNGGNLASVLFLKKN